MKVKVKKWIQKIKPGITNDKSNYNCNGGWRDDSEDVDCPSIVKWIMKNILAVKAKNWDSVRFINVTVARSR